MQKNFFSGNKMTKANKNENPVPSPSYFQRVKDYTKTKWNEIVEWIGKSKFVRWFRDNIPLLKPKAIDTAF